MGSNVVYRYGTAPGGDIWFVGTITRVVVNPVAPHLSQVRIRTGVKKRLTPAKPIQEVSTTLWSEN